MRKILQYVLISVSYYFAVKKINKIKSNQIKLNDMPTKKESLFPAKLGTKDVPAMIEAVNKQISKLQSEMPYKPRTDGVRLEQFGPIKDLNSMMDLIKAASLVMTKTKAYKEAAKEVMPKNVKTPTFLLYGHTEGQWLNDIKRRILTVAHKNELKKLIDIKNTLESSLSAEANLANDLEKIKGILFSEEGNG